jgi:hypothetical protein
MKKTGFLLAIALLFLLVGNVQAANICDSKKIPSYPSVNGSMLLIIPASEVDSKLSGLSSPMRIRWDVLDQDFYYIDYGGSLQKFGDCWICEFSGKESTFEGSCGPTPFKMDGQFRIDFAASDFDHPATYPEETNEEIKFNRTINIHSETMGSGVNVDSDGDVHITVDTPHNTEEVWVTLYDAEDGEMVSGFDKINLTPTLYTGRYLIDIDSLSGGTYYAAFGFRTAGGETGGDLLKFDIGEEEVELTAKTDKDSYFIGETVVISGRTKYSSVTASVEDSAGGKHPLGSADVSDGEYIYDYHITGDEEGDYEVTVTAGGKSAKEIFSVAQTLSVFPLSCTFDITDRSEKLEQNVTIRNVGNGTVTMSAGTEDVASYVTTELGEKSLGTSSSTKLKITVNPAGLSASKTGRVLITAGDVMIPVDVILNLDIETGPATGDGTALKISPGLWKEDDCIVGTPVSYTFTVQSLEGEITDFGYDETGLTVSDATLPESVDEDTFGSLDIEITPGVQRTSGTVEITSSGGSSVIYVSLDCIDEDTGDDISTMESDVDKLKLDFSGLGFDAETINSIFYLLTAELESASSSLDSERYASARESYMSAQARYETLQSLASELETSPVQADGGEENPLMTWIVIIVVVVIVALVGFVVYNKFGAKLLKKGGESEEEAIDEELY